MDYAHVHGRSLREATSHQTMCEVSECDAQSMRAQSIRWANESVFIFVLDSQVAQSMSAQSMLRANASALILF